MSARLDQPEAGVVAQRADAGDMVAVGDMVAGALKLKQQCPEPAGFHRHRDPARLFGGSVCRLASGNGVSPGAKERICMESGVMERG